MQRPIFAALAATLCSIFVSPEVLAQPASPGADAGTFQIPGAGVSMTLPADWRLWTSSDGGDQGAVISRVITRETCDIRLADDVATAQAAAGDLVASLEKQHSTIIERRSFEVPVGDAVYLSYRHAGLPDEPSLAWYEYRVTVPAGVLSVACTGADPPPDRWMSLIASLAAGPERPSSQGLGPRVEIPAYGIAMDFPSEWLVRSWPGWPGIVLGGDFLLRAQSTVAGADCWLEDDSRLPIAASQRSPGDWRETFADASALGWGRGTPLAPGRKPSEPKMTSLILPSGPALRADWSDWGGMPATAWVFQAPARAVVLFCRASEPPADAWRSMARTFTFTPAAAVWTGHRPFEGAGA
jgi:hypothetical protein